MKKTWRKLYDWAFGTWKGSYGAMKDWSPIRTYGRSDFAAAGVKEALQRRITGRRMYGIERRLNNGVDKVVFDALLQLVSPSEAIRLMAA